MLRNIELTRKSLAIDDYDDARAALLQAQALTKLLAVSGVTLDDPKCVSITVSVLEDLLERIEKRLETASSL
jgi:hypothetical protein